ncbi:MAG: secretin N-terminal domain-containing protein [Candidatus Omnitrophota bacterium]
MKTIRLFTAIIFTLVMMAPCSFGAETGLSLSGKPGAGSGNLISMDFQDANLKTVLKIFSQQSGLNFIASQNVQDRTVTIYFDNVKVEDALNYIMNANNLTYEQDPGTNIFIVKESGREAVETVTKIYELKYAQLTPPPAKDASSVTTKTEAEIVTILQSVLSENGKITADKRSNSLIIKDVPSQFAMIENLLMRLDIRTPQVMIKVEVLETTTKLVEHLGINWDDGLFGIYTGPIVNTIAPVGGKFGSGTSAYTDPIDTAGSVDFSSTSAKLYALLNNTNTKVLARPQVLTMNNEMAKIELTSKEVARQLTSTTAVGSSGATTGVTYEEKDTGVILEVTPQISKDGYVTMHLKPSVTDLEESRYTDQYDTHTRSTETTVMVRDGETVVMGGLIKTKNTHGLKKVPFLGDIPVLGLAFRYRSKDDSDKELIVFITPNIVKDNTYALSNVSEREQEKPKAVREKEIRSVLDLIGG